MRPRKFVEDDEEVVEEDLISELYIGSVSSSGGSSSTGDGSSSCIGTDDIEPREVDESRGGRSVLEAMITRCRRRQSEKESLSQMLAAKVISFERYHDTC